MRGWRAGGGVLAGCAAGIVVVLLVASVPAGPGMAVVGGLAYASETEIIFGPHTSNFTFRGVQFAFEVWCDAPSLAGAELCGNATGPDGVAHPFTFWEYGGPPTTSPRPWETWIAPGGNEGVLFEPDSGGLVRLLVRA
jgi:hypothetical protein